MESKKTWCQTLNILLRVLELLLEMFTSELEVLFDQVFDQTGVVMTFQSTISRGRKKQLQQRGIN